MKSLLLKAAPKRRIARRPQLERDTPLVALAVARTVLEEASLRLGRPLPSRLAARLAHQARRIYAHSPSVRRRLRAHGDTGRDTLHAFMHHWLDGLLDANCNFTGSISTLRIG